jgi:glucose-6-phosphate 1-dehydrogenase
MVPAAQGHRLAGTGGLIQPMTVPDGAEQSGKKMVIEGRAPEMESAQVPAGVPCLLIIFGASGDLTARKLFPALLNLYASGSLAEESRIVGCGRTRYNDDEFREKMKRACLAACGPEAAGRWPDFAVRLHYRLLTYDSRPDFAELAGYLQELDREHRTGWNRIFYLAVPPDLLPEISIRVGEAGLAEEGEEGSWARIVVEKPFGRDLESAMALDRILHRSFREHQIFRIDHYLAKETVQNILMLRFANTIFEPLWNRSYIDHVGIVTAEQEGVGHRTGYYEQAGVLRDMFQNHMLQLLALIAMEPPSRFEADMVGDEKVKVFRALKSLVAKDQEKNLVLGQYVSGKTEGGKMPAYRDEPGVDAGSLIPTFAMLRVFIDNWRWRDVPFYLVSGKRLASKETRIVIQFRKVPHSLFENILGDKIAANRLILGVYPEEEIKVTFQTKIPGPRIDLRPVTMDFKYYESKGPVFDAYEKVLLDVIQGDQLLFLRQDAVEQCWTFLTPILEICELCEDRAGRLKFYEAGSWGPEAARGWLKVLLAE